jgi:hypothetical protein
MPSKKVSYDFAQLDTDLLNNVKSRMTKTGMVQFQNLANIRSTIRPTKSRMNSVFRDIFNFLNNMYEILRIVPTASDDIIQNIEDKIATDYTQMTSEFITKYDMSYTQIFNYLDPTQVQGLKTAFIRLDNLIDYITEEQEVLTITLGNYLSLLQDNALSPLQNDIMNYSPMKVDLMSISQTVPSLNDSISDDMEGGYIAGGSLPERRFM